MHSPANAREGDGSSVGAAAAPSAEHFWPQLEAIAQHASLPLFLLDERHRCVYLNPAAERLTGFALPEVRGRDFHQVVHHTRPDGSPCAPPQCPVERAVAARAREQGEEQFVGRDGSFFRLAFTVSPVREGARVVGALVELRAGADGESAQDERARLQRELEVERARLRQVFVHAPALISVTRGPTHVFELVNPAYQRMVGARELVGRPLREALPELEGQGYFEMRDHLYATGETHVQNEARVLADLDGDGSQEEHYLNFVTQPLLDADGRVDGILTFAVDVTEQVRAREMVEVQAGELEAQAEELQSQAITMEEIQAELEVVNDELQRSNLELERRAAEAERAMQRLQVMAEAGATLSASLEVDTTLSELARLVVPRVADWCFVELSTPDGGTRQVAVQHRDPALVELIHHLLERYPVGASAAHGAAGVLRTGQPELLADIPEEVLRSVARDSAHLEALRRVGFRSSISVPLEVRGRTVGVLSLVMADSGRRFGEEDLPFVQELARRAALAVDNSRLYAAEQAARQAAERAAQRSRRLQAVAAALNEAATPEQVAAVAVAHGMSALGADRGSLALLDEEATTFRIASSSFPQDLAARWESFPVRSGRPLSDAVLQRAPVLIGGPEEWARRYPQAFRDLRSSGTAAFAAVPMVSGGRPLGGLSFSFEAEQRFDEADEIFLRTLGEQVSQALARAQLFEAERLARTEAENANRAKTDFLSAMSHELRTPLNAIAGYVDLLDMGVRGQLSDTQRADLARIRRAEEVLLGLINDILNFARIEAGRIEYRSDEVPLLPLLEDLQGMIEPQARAKRLEYRFHPCAADLAVVGDAERIRQILINLLSNAVKFTDPGGTVVVEAAASQDQVEIRVRDSGRGIPREKLEAIFEPFVQIDRHVSQDGQQGIGLGLAISRELALAMGGNLAAQSAPGEGSVFSLTLPLFRRSPA